MSNLGWYQVMTVLAKKVGGPINLAAITAGAGSALTLLTGFSVQAIIRWHRTMKGQNQLTQLIDVTSAGTDDSGLTFDVGDSYRILYSDTDMVLVEKIGDTNNPYMVSPDFLRLVSNYS